MLNAMGILISSNSEKYARLLSLHKGDIQIFDIIKHLNYPENVVILSLRLIKSMCLIHNDISTHLIKESNVFNFITHIMKHWRLKGNDINSLRIQCCCQVIQSLSSCDKFTRYANKCHVISGLIKILLIDNAKKIITNYIY